MRLQLRHDSPSYLEKLKELPCVLELPLASSRSRLLQPAGGGRVCTFQLRLYGNVLRGIALLQVLLLALCLALSRAGQTDAKDVLLVLLGVDCALFLALGPAPWTGLGCLSTLAVWHRCLNSEENSFISLCAQHAHVLELPASIPAAVQQYGAYLKQLLVCCFKCKYAYHRDELELDSRVDTLKVEEVVVHGTCILARASTSPRFWRPPSESVHGQPSRMNFTAARAAASADS